MQIMVINYLSTSYQKCQSTNYLPASLKAFVTKSTLAQWSNLMINHNPRQSGNYNILNV